MEEEEAAAGWAKLVYTRRACKAIKEAQETAYIHLMDKCRYTTDPVVAARFADYESIKRTAEILEGGELP